MTNSPLTPQTLVVYESTDTTRHLFLERASRRRNLITLEPRVWHQGLSSLTTACYTINSMLDTIPHIKEIDMKMLEILALLPF